MPREQVRHPEHTRQRSLGVVLEWIEWFCVHGPGDVQGVPLHPRHGDGALPLDDEFATRVIEQMYDLFIFPASSSKIRRLQILSAAHATSAAVSAGEIPINTTRPAPN